jgi:hypothetical protein|nr:MAG TPA: hypothetical protein [Caudoviricetes sp.]
MFYKVEYNGKTIDLLENPIYVKYQKKHDIFLSCPETEAQGVMSSDHNTIWHVDIYPSIEKENIDTVSLIEIDKYEYQKLYALNLKTAEEIIDAYTLELLNGGIL